MKNDVPGEFRKKSVWTARSPPPTPLPQGVDRVKGSVNLKRHWHRDSAVLMANHYFVPLLIHKMVL